jgi:hypothetical protein
MVDWATVRELLTEVAPATETVDAKVAPPAVTANPLSSEKVLFRNEMFWVDVAPVPTSK